ncbi:cytochrome P450 [Phaeosphaeria sp. MPI-PUGE-AT-0046c]|nr:cytochrome P450 [Phaeosphaeria sp. MPI-PUGE-AT-0046c]
MRTAMDWLSEFSVITLLVCTITVFVGCKAWKHARHPLRRFPGPKLAACTNAPYSYWLLRGRQPFVMLKLHEKYGPVVRIAPNELSFNTAASWKDIYGYRPGHKPFCKGSFYDGAAFVESTGTRSVVNTKDPAEHGRMRRHLANAFSEKSMREQETLIAKEVDTLVEQLGRFGAAKDGTDLQRWLNMAAFDITGSLSFGKSFDALHNGGSHPTVVFILRALLLLSFLDTVKRRIEEPRNRPDILTRIIEKKEEASISDVQIAAHAADLLTAGSDSTNTCISTVFYYLFKHSNVMQRVQAEICSSFDTYHDINALSTNNLSYTIAVIREALRIFPPLPLGLPRVVPEGGDIVDGYLVPGGTAVSTNPFAACLDSRNFEDAWTFRPERWMEEGGRDIRDASQPFSLGTRTCIGQK